MKKYYFFLTLVLTSIDSFSQTNVYYPFPENNAVWCDSVGLNQSVTDYCGVLSYSLSGDTLINGKTYHKLLKNVQSFYVHHFWCYPNYPNPFYSGYAGAIRQDTAQRKVYFLPPAAYSDSLLYDFSLNVGDTLKTYITYLCLYSPIVVTSTDSILIGSNYRKRWIINQLGCITNGEIIEGIGSTFGLLEYQVNMDAGGSRQAKLYCFSHNNQTFYPNYSNTSGCSLIESIQEQPGNDLISISPNPSNGRFVIEAHTSDKKNIDLYDMNGRHVYSNIISDKAHIDVTNLNEGIYILTIKTTNHFSNIKIVLVP